MAEEGEGLGIKVISVIVQRYGVLPREMWDLNSRSDMGAGRGVNYKSELPEATFKSITSNDRYTITNLTIYPSDGKSKPASTLRQRKMLVRSSKYRMDFPASLRELTLGGECRYKWPLVHMIPDNLQKLVLDDLFSRPITFPSHLLELELGSAFNLRLVLPHGLKRLTFAWNSRYNLPVALPESIRSIRFGDAYDQPTDLPDGIEELRIGSAFTHDISLPNSLRKIVWCCNRPIQIPEGVCDVTFCCRFDQPVELPNSLRKASFFGSRYSHVIDFPEDLSELMWHTQDHIGFVLPQRLKKLYWGSTRHVSLPLGLKELVIIRDAPMILPSGLLKIALCDGGVGFIVICPRVCKK